MIAIAGISHTIAVDAALLQRYPDAKTDPVSPQQPRWRWFARACQLQHGVPCALLIEADSGYLLVVSHLAESAFEFGGNTYVFQQGGTDDLIELTGVTGVTGISLLNQANAAAVGDIFVLG